MELQKVYDGKELEVHEAWYGQRLKFSVYRYKDGRELIQIWDYSQNKALFEYTTEAVTATEV